MLQVHPAVLAATLLACPALAGCVLAWARLYPHLQVAPGLRHALPNLWLASILLSVSFLLSQGVGGVAALCRAAGLLLHYSALAAAAWLAIAASLLHRQQRPPRPRTGVGRHYLLGWGGPLLVCGLTAGAGWAQYSVQVFIVGHWWCELDWTVQRSAGSPWCFLSPLPAAGAVLAPLGLTLLTHAVLLVSSLVQQQKQQVYTSRHSVTSDSSAAGLDRSVNIASDI